jgi:hypothetical protein
LGIRGHVEGFQISTYLGGYPGSLYLVRDV